jgi:hypothetical protein
VAEILAETGRLLADFGRIVADFGQSWQKKQTLIGINSCDGSKNSFFLSAAAVAQRNFLSEVQPRTKHGRNTDCEIAALPGLGASPEQRHFQYIYTDFGLPMGKKSVRRGCDLAASLLHKTTCNFRILAVFRHALKSYGYGFSTALCERTPAATSDVALSFSVQTSGGKEM